MGGGRGAEFSGIVPSPFELCSRASTSEFLFTFLVSYEIVKIHKFTYGFLKTIAGLLLLTTSGLWVYFIQFLP